MLIVNYVRVLRIFRTMNVVTRWKRIKIIWDAVVNTFSSLLFITILMFLFFYIFAIIGIHLFDRFTRSHRIDLDYHKAFAVGHFCDDLNTSFYLSVIALGFTKSNGDLIPIVYIRSLVQITSQFKQRDDGTLVACDILNY